jgi:VWFA-related protein
MTTARTLSTTILLLLALNLRAQEPKPTIETKPDASNTLSVNANLVVLSVVIRDKKGALVNTLTKDDFSLKVKDQPQTIRYFDYDTDVPLTLGLLVDVSRSMRDSLDGEKKASESFLETMLKPADTAKAKRDPDKAFVIQFAKQIELLQDVTADRPKLEKALAELGTEDPSFHTTEKPDTTDSEGRREHHGGTSLYDSLFLASNDVTSKQTGRKALVVLTDGVDSGSKESLTDAIEAAQRADTIVYAVYYAHRW